MDEHGWDRSQFCMGSTERDLHDAVLALRRVLETGGLNAPARRVVTQALALLEVRGR